MSRASRTRGLGRGLDALFSQQTPEAAAPPPSRPPKSSGNPRLMLCPLERLHPNREQPRKQFEPKALEELAESIRQHGLLEPIVVRRGAKPDHFDIVAGERRWRAAQRAGLREVPVHLLEVEAQAAFELAIVENIQREDLNPIEFAEALQRLTEQGEHTHESLAALLKKNRSTIANALRLLKLPQEVRQAVNAGRLSEGHARAILAAPSSGAMVSLCNRVLAQGLSVRKTEALAKSLRQSGPKATAEVPSGKSPGVRDLEGRLSRRFGARCEVRDKSGKGEIVLRYGSLDELDGLLERLFAEAP